LSSFSEFSVSTCFSSSALGFFRSLISMICVTEPSSAIPKQFAHNNILCQRTLLPAILISIFATLHTSCTSIPVNLEKHRGPSKHRKGSKRGVYNWVKLGREITYSLHSAHSPRPWSSRLDHRSLDICISLASCKTPDEITGEGGTTQERMINLEKMFVPDFEVETYFASKHAGAL
jgi:hypothetical protein